MGRFTQCSFPKDRSAGNANNGALSKITSIQENKLVGLYLQTPPPVPLRYRLSIIHATPPSVNKPPCVTRPYSRCKRSILHALHSVQLKTASRTSTGADEVELQENAVSQSTQYRFFNFAGSSSRLLPFI